MLPPGATTGERHGLRQKISELDYSDPCGQLLVAVLRVSPARSWAWAEKVDLAATMGDLLVGAPVNMFTPRPVFEGAVNRITEEEYQKQQAQQAAQQQAQEMSEAQAQQELISLLLGAGAIGGRALG